MAKNNNDKAKISSWLPTLAVVFGLYLGHAVLPRLLFISLCVAGTAICTVGFLLTFKMLQRKNDNKKAKVLNTITLLVGIVCVVGAVFNGSAYEFIDESFIPFWGISLIIGIALGVISAIKAVKTNNAFIRILIGIILSLLFTFVASMYVAHLNYLLDFSNPTVIEGVIVDKEIDEHRRSPDEYVFEVDVKGEAIDVKVTRKEYEKYNEGDAYTFYKCNGAFNEPFYMSE